MYVATYTITTNHLGEDGRFLALSPDGEVRWIRDRAFPIEDDRGEVRRIGGIAEDITEWKEAERELQRHAKLRLASLFAGSLEGAHRWATLLGVVRTAQKHDLDVQAYLTWLFERRGTHRARFGLSAKELTPAAYKAAGCPGSLTEDATLAA